MGYSLPFFPIYAAETLADGRFQGWTLEERGAWLTLLCYAWNDGDLPSAHTDLARLLHIGPGDMARIWSAIGDRFCHVPGRSDRVCSPRLENERDKAESLSMKRGKAGKIGATARWSKGKKLNGNRMRLPLRSQCDSDAVAMANGCPPPPSSPPPPPPPPPSPPTSEKNSHVPASPVDRGGARLAGNEGLGDFRKLLAKRLGVGRVTVGRDPAGVLAFFGAQLARVGEAELLDDCVEAARRSTSGTPSSLSWFVGWLDRLPAETRQ